MNKEYLRMQKLAGVITEGQYKEKLEESKIENIADKVADNPKLDQILSKAFANPLRRAAAPAVAVNPAPTLPTTLPIATGIIGTNKLPINPVPIPLNTDATFSLVDFSFSSIVLSSISSTLSTILLLDVSGVIPNCFNLIFD